MSAHELVVLHEEVGESVYSNSCASHLCDSPQSRAASSVLAIIEIECVESNMLSEYNLGEVRA